MKYINNLYKVIDSDEKLNISEYKKELGNEKKNERKRYKRNVKQRELVFLTFRERNKFKISIVIIFLILFVSVLSILLLLKQDGNLLSQGTDNDGKVISSKAEKLNDNSEIDKSLSNSVSKVKDNSGLKKKDEVTKEENKSTVVFKVGDVVYFVGNTQYRSSNSNSKRVKTESGKAKITRVNKQGVHQYHIIGIDKDTNIFGWVDKKDLKKKID